jgi:AraC-like DNA-binding protein
MTTTRNRDETGRYVREREAASGRYVENTAERDREIAAKYAAGATTFELSVEYDVCCEQVRRARRRYGVAPHPQPTNAQSPKVQRALRMYREAPELTVLEIAGEFGVSERQVYRWVKRAGLAYSRQPQPRTGTTSASVHRRRLREQREAGRAAQP